jgi:hypothetical protein
MAHVMLAILGVITLVGAVLTIGATISLARNGYDQN